MKRSNINTEKSDFNRIKELEHIENVWSTIKEQFAIYFERMLDVESEFGALKESGLFKIKQSPSDNRKVLSDIFVNGMAQFERENSKYGSFFDVDKLQEFEDDDDPKGFKTLLSTKVPVIHKARNSKREMMKEWQTRFANSKANDIYAIFFNLMAFMNDYVDETKPSDFFHFDSLNQFENLSVLNDYDDFNVPGVIGMGIKSSVLYYLNPQYFLCANKNTLYGFYFLSDSNYFDLYSRTNEFIMLNDMKEESNKRYNTNMLIDQNYWYPYDLFILYGLRLYRLLKENCGKYNLHLSDEFKFVHVNTFMAQIWKMNLEKINTMTGGDQEDAR